MNQILIFYPLLTLVFFTFAVTLYLGRKRINAVKDKKINVRFFKLNTGFNEPEDLKRISQNYDNLLAMPQLFYLACIIAFILSQVDVTLLMVSWFYVILRIAHSVIHIGNNSLRHRFPIFAASVFILIYIWINLAIGIINL